MHVMAAHGRTRHVCRLRREQGPGTAMTAINRREGEIQTRGVADLDRGGVRGAVPHAGWTGPEPLEDVAARGQRISRPTRRCKEKSPAEKTEFCSAGR